MKNSKNLIDKKEQGKKNRKSGAAFELKVRKDLESKGWIVSKFMNNVEIENLLFHEGCGAELKKIENKEDVYFCPKCDKVFNKNEINFQEGFIAKLIPAKRKYNPFNKVMMVSGGFPDFICHRLIIDETRKNTITIETENEFTKEEDCDFRKRMSKPYEVIGVEAKSNGYLTKEEKEKCSWYLEQGVFSKILIARKPKSAEELMSGESLIFKEFKSK